MNVDNWLENNTILLVRHGSHAYGTNIATSDEDIRGIAVPPAPYHLGYLHKFEQKVSHNPDITIFGLKKFCFLAAEGNPNALELLFVEDTDVLNYANAGALLRRNRDLFISKKLKHTLSGYAHSQLKRIKTHRRWLLNPPGHKPTRAEFNLPECTVIPQDQIATATSLVQDQIKEWEAKLHIEGVDDASRIAIATAITEMSIANDEKFRAAGRVIGLTENFLELLDRERTYGAAMSEWTQYENWCATRNEARAALEAQHGYDTKHAMHLVRLMRMCGEVLRTGELRVRRPDAAELLQIRAGAWAYDELIAWADATSKELDALYRESSLPTGPKRDEIDALCVRITKAYL